VAAGGLAGGVPMVVVHGTVAEMVEIWREHSKCLAA